MNITALHVIAEIYFSQLSVIYFFWGFSCCPYYAPPAPPPPPPLLLFLLLFAQCPRALAPLGLKETETTATQAKAIITDKVHFRTGRSNWKSSLCGTSVIKSSSSVSLSCVMKATKQHHAQSRQEKRFKKAARSTVEINNEAVYYAFMAFLL